MNEVSNCEAFRLGWEQALLDPLAHDFSGLEACDAMNQVESNNNDLDYYVTKENLEVDFVEDLDEETETQGEGSQASKSNQPDPLAKDQAKSKSHVASGSNPSELEGCLNVPFGAILSGNFDDNVLIKFNPPLLDSPIIPNLDFLDQTGTPQSQLSLPGTASGSTSPLKQAQPSHPKSKQTL